MPQNMFLHAANELYESKNDISLDAPKDSQRERVLNKPLYAYDGEKSFKNKIWASPMNDEKDVSAGSPWTKWSDDENFKKYSYYYVIKVNMDKIFTFRDKVDAKHLDENGYLVPSYGIYFSINYEKISEHYSGFYWHGGEKHIELNDQNILPFDSWDVPSIVIWDADCFELVQAYMLESKRFF